MNRRSLLLSLCLPAALALMPMAATAQDYPKKPITLIIPFPPGGATDIAARPFAQKLQAALGQPVIMENKPGAGGSVGASYVARAEPDGYTLLMGGVFMTVNPAVSKNAGYDPVKDFIPLGVGGEMPVVLVATPGLPANNVRELVALAKAKPGALNGASVGNGSLSHLALVLFNQQEGIDITHVPYPGAAKGKTDLMAGRVQVMFDSVASTIAQIQSGQLKALAISSRERVPELANVPTMIESGVKDFEVVAWNAFFAPAKTPDAIVRKLNEALVKIASEPDMKPFYAERGLGLKAVTPAEYKKRMESEFAKWGEAARKAGATID